MDAVGAAARLHDVVLAWDYFRLWDRAAEGKGVYDALPTVPQTFGTIEVRRCGRWRAACGVRRAAGGGRWRKSGGEQAWCCCAAAVDAA